MSRARQSTRYVVATVSEIPPGSRKVVTAGGRTIGVFNLGGEFFALLNRCPHQSGPLCEGHVWQRLSSDGPGDYQVVDAGELLRCPWHGWEFDIRTGQSWFDPDRTRVRRYPVSVESPGALQKGPYVAETFPVHIEEDVVVVEI
jgi:nitrite reductase/ring-hydroxylating ferredoxin subunit